MVMSEPWMLIAEGSQIKVGQTWRLLFQRQFKKLLAQGSIGLQVNGMPVCVYSSCFSWLLSGTIHVGGFNWNAPVYNFTIMWDTVVVRVWVVKWCGPLLVQPGVQFLEGTRDSSVWVHSVLYSVGNGGSFLLRGKWPGHEVYHSLPSKSWG